MTEITSKASAKKLSKKEARKLVSEKIAAALSEYKSSVKEKKFATNVKKASKLFAADIAKAFSRQKEKLKKPTKIKAVKNTIPEQHGNSSEAVV
jgi:hypothetical protein